MAKRKHFQRQTDSRAPPRKVLRAATEIRLHRAGDAGWEFLHPRCALDRADDVDEAHTMIEHEENEIACDELRWLLNGCPDFVECHKMLGELALAAEDLPLARGHFGHAYHAGLKAWQQAGRPLPLPYSLPANQPWFESGKGLVYCLIQLGERALADSAARQLTACDPSDPLNIRGML